MDQIRSGDGTMYTHGTMHQLGVGEIDLCTMVYTGSDNQIHATQIVEIRSWKAAPSPNSGWGEKIFDGSIEEAIDVFRAGLEARKKEGGTQ